MIEFDKNGTCYITLDNLLFLAHFSFTVIDLASGETLFEDNCPFSSGTKKRHVGSIVYNEINKTIFLISCSGDIAIYELNQKKKITKRFSYNEKVYWVFNHISPCWFDKEFLNIFLEKQDKMLLRRISYSGKIFDIDLKNCVTRNSLNHAENEILAKVNFDSKIIDTTSDSINFLELSKVFPELNKEDIISVFILTNKDSLYVLSKENDEVILHKKDEKLIKIDSFRRHYPDSYVEARIINNAVAIVEWDVDWDLLTYKVHFKYKNIEKEFDLSKNFKANKTFHLLSFNDRYIAFFDGNKVSILKI